MPDINLDLDAGASRYDAASSTWSARGPLENHTGSAFGASAGMDAQGNGFIVWRREQEADLWLSTYTPD